MAAGTPEYFGLKAYSAHAKTGAHFEVLLYRSADGLPLATLEANHLGQIRTGAASGVATKYLAREDASVAAIIGSGFQAETQLEAVANVRKLREVRVWSRKPERREEFARRCAEKFKLNVKATETARECVEGADIVVTATSSKATRCSMPTGSRPEPTSTAPAPIGRNGANSRPNLYSREPPSSPSIRSKWRKSNREIC